MASHDHDCGSPRGARVRAVALAVTLVSVLVTAGCESLTSTSLPPSPTASGSASAPTEPPPTDDSSDSAISPPRIQVGEPVTVLGTLQARPAGEARLEVTQDDDGSVRLDVHVPEGATPVVAVFEAPGSVFEVLPDGSMVASSDGVAVAGAHEPRGEGVDGRRQRATLGVVGDGVTLTVTRAPGSDDQPAGTASLWFTDAAVADLDWGEREGGTSLAVTPSAWARVASDAAEELVWAAVAAADGPDASADPASASMRDQLVCHLVGAPDKATWNLEPWRPDVGLTGVLAARCNPVEGA